jgi:hypothetical protein
MQGVGIRAAVAKMIQLLLYKFTDTQGFFFQLQVALKSSRIFQTPTPTAITQCNEILMILDCLVNYEKLINNALKIGDFHCQGH